MSQDKFIDAPVSPQSGFTLVELLVAMAMFAVLTVAGYNLLTQQRRINLTQQNLLELQSNARAATQTLIQAFNHAGFGCSENISSGNDVAGEDDYLNPTNNAFTGTSPDSVILVYGYEHVGTVNGAISAETTTVTVDNSTSMGTTDYLKHVAFFPSLTPSNFYEITGKTSTTITITPSITSLQNNSKIFRVNPIQFYVANNELRQRETDGIRDEVIAYDVQDFQVAYTTAEDNLNTATWVDNPANPEDVTAVWIYVILRTREVEPGFQEGRTFRLPWDAAQSFNGAALPAGLHYHEFQTKVWLRNAS